MKQRGILFKPKSHPIYQASDIKAWEMRWFKHGNSSYGLMEQAGLMLLETLSPLLYPSNLNQTPTIMIWCGIGNNGGDGYILARLLKEQDINVVIFAPNLPATPDARRARVSLPNNVPIYNQMRDFQSIDIHIDALFGNGLNHELSQDYQALINNFNRQTGIKIAIDLPSGLHPDTGQPLPVAVKADISLCLMGLKMGLFTAKGKHYAGQVINIPLIPSDDKLQPIAYINTRHPDLPPRNTYAHKGDFGHVLIIGGSHNMGGAVIMAGEAAMACGAGKVTIMCHPIHHTAILSRSPNIMVKDINDELTLDYLKQIDTVAFGMGLGRDAQSKIHYKKIMTSLEYATHLTGVVLDADALYFLAKQPQTLAKNWIATPHSSEAGRLLNKTAKDIEQDRIQAINELQQRYGGNWVLKGAGSLSSELDKSGKALPINVCAFGNAGMATAGMGDVLSGMIAGLYKQANLADCVALHALAGDELAKNGQIGIQTHAMPKAIRHILNAKST